MSEFGIPSFDTPDPEAEQKAIERVANLVLIRLQAEGEDTPGAIAKRQLEMIASPGESNETLITLYSNFEEDQDLVCSAEVNVDLGDDDTHQVIEYRFFSSEGYFRAEKYSQIYATTKVQEQIDSLFKGNLERRKAVMQEMQDEEQARYSGERLSREIGLHTATASELAELEDLILSGRAIKI